MRLTHKSTDKLEVTRLLTPSSVSQTDSPASDAHDWLSPKLTAQNKQIDTVKSVSLFRNQTTREQTFRESEHGDRLKSRSRSIYAFSGEWNDSDVALLPLRGVYLCPFIPVLYLSHHINICPLFTQQIGSNKQVCSLQRRPNLPAD